MVKSCFESDALILGFNDELLPQNLGKMQRHDETGEVFVLLAGRCILFVGEGTEQVSETYAQDMEPLKLYNVKRNCRHTRTQRWRLRSDRRKSGHDSHNSSEITLDTQRKLHIIELTRQAWGESKL